MPGRNKLVYLTPAAEDMEEILRYHLEQVGPASARTVYARMRRAIARLAAYPLMGQSHPDPLLAAMGFRKLVLTGTYVAVYKVIEGTVYIYRVVNGKTDYPKLLK